ncbi:cupin domain-containing protein, partial [Hoeflea sp.]|uniref:cupin domain-containing protein n=1 Tax=Hoeflea sp. TaxID=1940281 RepID=UPI003A90673D
LHRIFDNPTESHLTDITQQLSNRALRETYAVGADSGELLSHVAQEAGCVVSGAIELTVGNQCRVLHKGDGYYFDSRELHRFRNVGKTTAEVISAISPPSY